MIREGTPSSGIGRMQLTLDRRERSLHLISPSFAGTCGAKGAGDWPYTEYVLLSIMHDLAVSYGARANVNY